MAAYNAPMRILIANDDGYLAPGLAALVQACAGLGEIDVVAPEQNASGTSNALTLNRPLSVFEAAGGDHVKGFRVVNGTPSDCVHVALTGLLPQRPDLVLSGINNGANMGDDTLYSGTVAAAMEGYLFGIPAIAFSQVHKGWGASRCRGGGGARRSSTRCWPGGMPTGRGCSTSTFRTVADAAALPRRITRLGRRHASRAGDPPDQPARRADLLDRPGRRCPRCRRRHRLPCHGANGCVSITPLQVDLTDHASLRPLGGIARLAAAAWRR